MHKGIMQLKSKLRVTGNPVFILGIMPRSGTNFLNNLLLLHPDCEYPGIVWEDYYLDSADLLHCYSETVFSRWNQSWKEKVEDVIGPNPLLKLLGDSLVTLMELQYVYRKDLQSDDNFTDRDENNKKRLVSATPTVENLNLFFDLFPEAQLIIIVRDGRAVVESGVKTFNWDYEEAMRRWANSARLILEFSKTNPGEDKFLIIRYEDLYKNTIEEVRKILYFLKLPVNRYDFDKAVNLDVMGSSQIRNKESKTDWVLRKKTKDFNPLERYTKWGRPLYERFNWLAGYYLKQFGYETHYNNESNFLWNVWNKIIDVFYALEIRCKTRLMFASKIFHKLRFFLLALNLRYKVEKLSDKKN